MSWTYSDWRSQTTAATQLARLALHMQEIEDAIGKNVSADGKSLDSTHLVTLLERMDGEYKRLIAATGNRAYVMRRGIAR